MILFCLQYGHRIALGVWEAAEPMSWKHMKKAVQKPREKFMLYDMKSKPEYEANIVAAEILMDNDEVLPNPDHNHIHQIILLDLTQLPSPP